MKQYRYFTGVILASITFIFFSKPAYSINCGAESPSVKKGIDPRTSIEPVLLTQNEAGRFIKLFDSFEGKWKGSAQISECIAKDGKDAVRQESSLVELSVESTSQDSIEMEFEIRSPSRGTRKVIIEKLYIDQDYLMFNDGPFNFKASVLYSRDNFITYLRKTKLPGKGNIPIEFVRTLAIYGPGSLKIEDLVYVNGMLSSTTLYELKQ